MLSADPMVDTVVHAALNLPNDIPAENVHVVLLSKLVAELLHLNCRLWITFCPKQMHALREDGNPRMLHDRGLERDCDEVAEGAHEQCWIGSTTAHEGGKYVSSIQREIPTLLNRHAQVHAVRLQSGEKNGPV